MAKENKKKKSKGKKSSKWSLLVIIPAIIILVILMKASFVLVLFGILPSIVAYYADTTEEKMNVSTIACCNLSGVLPYLIELKMGGNSWDMLGYYLSDLTVWLIMYGMAGLGYALVTFCPLIFGAVLRAVHTSKIFQLQQRQDTLVKEWGEGITQPQQV